MFGLIHWCIWQHRNQFFFFFFFVADSNFTLYGNKLGTMMAEITTAADQNFFRTYREIITMIRLNGKHQV